MLAIIPLPQEVIERTGYFELNSNTKIIASDELVFLANYFNELINLSTDFKLAIVNRTDQLENTISLTLKPKKEKNYQPEGYNLNITKDRIVLSATEPVGVFYGLQTIRQILPKEIEKKSQIKGIIWTIPCITINDFPRFKWRGFMLDEARHFMGKEIVKQILDVMALHKLNKFHWHLVDDQGWRIEIKKYPKLVEIGAKRKVVTRRGEQGNFDNGTTIGGYYTQEDIKEIVVYAKKLFIDVIPEIEMPGHCSASLAAYPELSCTGGPFEVPTRWGIFSDVYCPGKDIVYQFLQDVLDEVMVLFPYEIIHIGGDEVPKKRWKSCPDCQKKMLELNIANEHKLQVYLTNYFTKYLETKGKRLMGWNQILDPELSPKALCQFWFGKRSNVIEHIERGGEVVATNYLQTYLDHPYKIISLKKAYKFNPTFLKLNPLQEKQIIGIEPPLWTERIPNTKRLYWQAFPRLTAYAETAWLNRKKKNYNAFLSRLVIFNERLEIMGIIPAMEKIDKIQS